MAAARGRKEVGERVWRCGLFAGGGEEEVDEEGEVDGEKRWEDSERRRSSGPDISD